MLSPEQKRQKEEAMREAEHCAKHDTVDGSPGRAMRTSHLAHMSYESEEKREHGAPLSSYKEEM